MCVKITKENGVNGTGFFCKVPFPDHSDLFPVLATNFHVLNENDIKKNKIIEVTLNDDNKKKIIKIEKSRIIFSDANLDVTFIQIKPEKDNIKHFLEISEDILNNDKNILETKYRKKSIYIIHYPKGKNIKVSYGLINNILDNNITHYCITENGSSGSPVLSLDNFKIIGIHYGASISERINKSSFMKSTLIAFNQFIKKCIGNFDYNNNFFNNNNNLNNNNQNNFNNNMNNNYNINDQNIFNNNNPNNNNNQNNFNNNMNNNYNNIQNNFNNNPNNNNHNDFNNNIYNNFYNNNKNDFNNNMNNNNQNNFNNNINNNYNIFNNNFNNNMNNNNKNNFNNNNNANNNNNQNNNNNVINVNNNIKNTPSYNNIEDITLDNKIIKKYFNLIMLSLYKKNFKAETIELQSSHEDLKIRHNSDDDNEDYAKIIENTNTILIYYKKTNKLIKRKLNLQNNPHGYTTFPIGCRSLLLGDKVYISGGKSNIKLFSNVLIYDIKKDKIKRIMDLNIPRAYHSMFYIDLFKSLIVFGGELNKTVEFFDPVLSRWIKIANLNYPRSNIIFNFDKNIGRLYTIFGIEGKISEYKYSDIIEYLDLYNLKEGWKKLNYYNRTSTNLKCNKNVLRVNENLFLIYGLTLPKERKKVAVLLNLNKKEVVNIDKNIYEELKFYMNKNKTLTNIITSMDLQN